MISYSSKNLTGILFNLYYLLQSLKEIKFLMLPFIQIGPRWSDFYITLKEMSKVIYFIYSRLFRLFLALKKDTVDHRDI